MRSKSKLSCESYRYFVITVGVHYWYGPCQYRFRYRFRYWYRRRNEARIPEQVFCPTTSRPYRCLRSTRMLRETTTTQHAKQEKIEIKFLRIRRNRRVSEHADDHSKKRQLSENVSRLDTEKFALVHC
jgi:hypothetical protein